jgi:VWFA-related protein
MRPLRVHVSICLLVLGALAAPESRTRQSQSAFLAGVEVVEVPVTVLNGKREPVRGLRAEDFTVFEDGKPRPVVAFAAVETAAQKPRADASAGAPEESSAGTTPVAGSAAPADDGRLVVMILDRSIPFGAPSHVAKMVARSVVHSMAPNDLGAVIYTGASQRSQDVTGDRGLLLAAIGGEIFSTDSPGVRFQDEIARDPRWTPKTDN